MADLTVLNDYNVRAGSKSGSGERNLENYDLLTIKHSNWKYDNRNGVGSFGLICSAPLTDRPSFKVSPKYTTFGSVGANLERNIPGGQFFQTMRNVSTWQTMSRKRESPYGNIDTAKLYQGASDMSWSFKFRMFEGLSKESQYSDNDKCDGQSLTPLVELIPLCLPKLSEDTLKNLNSMFDSFANPALGSNILGALAGTLKLAGMQIKGAWKGVKNLGGTIFKKDDNSHAPFQYPSDQFAWRTENCIDVQVSNVLNLENMVIDSFDATFSREVLKNGLPVYTDYNIGISPIVQPCVDEVTNRWLTNFLDNYQLYQHTLMGQEWAESEEKRKASAAGVKDLYGKTQKP